MTARRLDRFATDRWIDKLPIPRACKALLRCLVSKVDANTGASHPRFPILQAAISMAISYSVAHICRAFIELEKLGYVIRRAMRARLTKGRIAQLPTDYQLVLPDECWREIVPVEQTAIARAPAPRAESAPEPAPVAPESRWSRSVRGRLSEQSAAPKVPVARWKLDATNDHTFIDGLRFDELAPKLLDAAMLASEGASDDMRHRVVVCLNELRTRAHEVALLACNIGIASWDAVAAVRGWVRKCLLNPAQRVDSAEHSMNILRKFVHEQAETTYTDKLARRREEKRRLAEEESRPMTYSEALAAYHHQLALEQSKAQPEPSLSGDRGDDWELPF
jgi:hypothetical protein